MYHFAIAVLSPIFAMFVGIAPLVVLMAYRTLRPFAEGSSLTRDLLRPPGHSLQERLERHQEDGVTLILATMFFAMSYGIVIAVETSLRPGLVPWVALVVVVSLGLAVGIVLFRKLDRHLRRGRELYAGLRGEMATGEELNTLMLDGYRVFHDVPIEHGNVDHVVVGVSGLYAVETKHIRRKIASEDSARLTVDFDRNVIELPRGEIPVPLAQLETQRKDLSSFLSDAIGERVEAETMLAIPGWYISRRGKPTFTAFNPKNPRAWFQSRSARLSATTVTRIAHQLDRICRDVPAKKSRPKVIAED